MTNTLHAVALVNLRSGEVEGHKAGCADLKRGHRKQADEAWTLEVADKHQAWEAYNGDFIAECEHDDCDVENTECRNAYEIKWLPCANHVPDFAEVTLEDVAAAVERSQDVTVKRGRIWTYVYRGDILLAEVRTDAADAVIAALQA